MKFIDINDIEYNLYDKDINIEFIKEKNERNYSYEFILTVWESPKKTKEYIIERLKWGQYSYLPKEMENIKKYYRFELDEMMKYYNEFLLYLFYRKQNENFTYDCKNKTINNEPIGKIFNEYLINHYSDVFNFDSLNEIEKNLK